MNKFIGGFQNGQDFPFDLDKYEGSTFKAGDIKTGESETYRKVLVGEHTFWVVESMPNEVANDRIKKILGVI